MFEETPEERESFDFLFSKCLLANKTPTIDLKKFKECFMPSGLNKSQLKSLFSASLKLYANKGMDRNCFGIFCKFVILEMSGQEISIQNLSINFPIPSFMKTRAQMQNQGNMGLEDNYEVTPATALDNGEVRGIPANTDEIKPESRGPGMVLQNDNPQTIPGNQQGQNQTHKTQSFVWDDKYKISFDEMNKYLKYSLNNLKHSHTDSSKDIILLVNGAVNFFEPFKENFDTLKEMWSMLDRKGDGRIHLRLILIGIHFLVLKKKFNIWIPEVFMAADSDAGFKAYFHEFMTICLKSNSAVEILQNLYPEEMQKSLNHQIGKTQNPQISKENENVKESTPRMNPNHQNRNLQGLKTSDEKIKIATESNKESLKRKDSALDEPRCMPRTTVRCQNFSELHNPEPNPVQDLNILGNLYSGDTALFFNNILGYLKSNLRYNQEKQKGFLAECQKLDEENASLVDKLEEKKFDFEKSQALNKKMMLELSEMKSGIENINTLISDLKIEAPISNFSQIPSGVDLKDLASQQISNFQSNAVSLFDKFEIQRNLNTEEIIGNVQNNLTQIRSKLDAEHEIASNAQGKDESDPFCFGNSIEEEENLSFNDPFGEREETPQFQYQKLSEKEGNIMLDHVFETKENSSGKKKQGTREMQMSQEKIEKQAGDLFGEDPFEQKSEDTKYLFP